MLSVEIKPVILKWAWEILNGSRVCETFCTNVLKKKHNLLQIEKRGYLYLKLSQSLGVQLDKLIDTRSTVVISQDLYLLFSFCFYK